VADPHHHRPGRGEPVDPGLDSSIDLAIPVRPAAKPDLWRGQGPVVAAVAVGGVLGACARYGMGLAWPTPVGAFPWTTFVINLVGCFVIGVFLVVITEAWAAHRLVRPFFGTGVLGGFTTFSTYAVDIQRLVDSSHAVTGLAYLTATLVAAMASVWTAAAATRHVISWRQQ
jgi:CrcB protein